MPGYPLPANEKERLKSLHQYGLLDEIPKEEYNRITKIASQICNTPVSLLTLLDETSQWVKSSYGFALTKTPRELAFCNYTIMDPSAVLEVPDLRKDDRFSSNPLVASDPHVVFYAGAPLIAPDGFALGSICVLDREQKKLNGDQREALVALAQQVMNSFELKLNVQTLKKTQRRLRKVNVQLKSYAQIVSHDIKTPIANIKILTRILEQEHLEPCRENKEVVRLMYDSADGLLEFIDGVLNRSRIFSGRSKKSKLVSTRQVVNKVIRMIAPAHDISIYVDGDLPKVKSEPILIQHVFQNLITNAIKYNDKAAPVIRISAVSNNCYHSFRVADNGCGISEQKLKDVFSAIDAGTEVDRYGNRGTGFGLHSIKSCLQEIGAKIDVTSKRNEGSVFTFHIPV